MLILFDTKIGIKSTPASQAGIAILKISVKRLFSKIFDIPLFNKTKFVSLSAKKR